MKVLESVRGVKVLVSCLASCCAGLSVKFCFIMFHKCTSLDTGFLYLLNWLVTDTVILDLVCSDTDLMIRQK